MNQNVELLKASRDELIEALKNRPSITSVHVSKDGGGTISTSHSSVAVDGNSWIFVVKPNEIK